MMKEGMTNNQLDDFSEKIKEKLANHSVNLNEDLWPAIQKNIHTPKRIIPLWVYYTTSAAAVVALLISVGNFFFVKESVIPVSKEIKAYQQEANQQLINTEENSIVLFEEIPEETYLVSNTSASKGKKVLIEEEIIRVPEEESSIANLISEKESTDQIAQNQQVDNKQVEDNQTETKQVEDQSDITKVVEKQTSLPIASSIQKDWTDVKSKKKRKRISISAMFGSGVTGSSATISPRSYSYRGESLMDIKTQYTNVLTPRDFKQKEYLPPMSAGLSTRLPVTDRFAIESGFMYTILQTRLSNSTSRADFRASLDLHYLGVPANFVYSMIKEKRWDVYVSAGGMMEKGLQSDFKQYQNWDDARISVEANPNIEGLQWSFNSSIGVGYLIHQHISFFFDPQLSYYFDNNQPYSIRKELPVIFSLNTGLRVIL